MASGMSALRSSTVGDWASCGDAFYSRELLYEMAGWEDVDLENMRVCGAPYGGPVAVVRDESQLVVIKAGSIRPVVRFYAASGRKLGEFMWEKGHIVQWGWSSDLELLLMDGLGRVVVLSMHGEKMREFTMGVAVEKLGISKALVYADGVVVLTQQAPQLWAVVGLSDPRPVPLAALPPSVLREPSGVCCMAVLEPHQTVSGALEVLVGSSAGVCQLDDSSATEHAIPGLSIVRKFPDDPGAPPPDQPTASASPSLLAAPHVQHLAVSSNGSFVAVYTSDGCVHVFSADFLKQLSEFDTKADCSPTQLAWCGSDAVVVQWPELLLVVGPYGDAAHWDLSGDKLVLVQEVDSIRLMSGQRHELLRKVPHSIAEVQRPGSTAPAAQLWDARDLFEQHSAGADRMLRSLRPEELGEAVASCVEAAGLDLSPARQKALLRTACYGGAFRTAGQLEADSVYYQTCCQLRVLNALREPNPGIPLTLPQLNALSMHVVVSRLVAYREWLLAYRIAESIQQGTTSPSASFSPAASSSSPPAAGGSLKASAKLFLVAAHPQQQVLLQWACAKMSAPSSSSLPDLDIKDQITSKLKACPGIHYAPLAAHAQKIGRRKLALRLLEEESSCSLQVPLLLSLSVSSDRRATSDQGDDGDGEVLLRALRRAIESGDTDLVYLVLFHIYRHRSLQDFWAIVSSKTLARNLFVKFCKLREPELLETILTVNHQVPDLAELQVRQALSRYADAMATSRSSASAASASASLASRAAAGGGRDSGSAQQDAALLALTSALGDASNKFGTSREHAFHSKATAEFAQLRREQARLEREVGQRLFVGLSLVDTVRTCIKLGHHKQALAFKKTFNISDKRFYWLKVLTLCEDRSWATLEDFAGERKSPIGWGPFLELAKKNAAPRDVQSRLIQRMPDSVAKAECFTAIECTREAAEVAAKLRDQDLFARIQGLVPATSPAGLAIAQVQERFRAGFR